MEIQDSNQIKKTDKMAKSDDKSETFLRQKPTKIEINKNVIN